MSAIRAGVAIPSDILNEPWFGTFGLFVALNTVIYLGLTAAKFVPWPAQVQPRQVRRLLPHSHEDETMPTPRKAALRALEDPARSLRMRAARQTIPVALALVGALTTVISLIYLLLYYAAEGPIMIVPLAFGVALIALSMIMARRPIRPEFMVWAWTVLMMGLIVETCWRAVALDSAVPLGVTLIVLVFTAPIALSWPAGIVASIAGTGAIVTAGAIVSVVDTISWSFAALSAALSGLVLLYLRVIGMDRIAEERARADALASTDPLTGTFTRTGLIALAPSIASAAEQSGDEVATIMCEIEDLAMLNADYGFDYGGAVIAATARSFRSALPERAIVSRWEGDTFLAVMTGHCPDREAVQRHVIDNLVTSGVALGKKPVIVTVTGASGDPRRTTLEALIAEASPSAPPRG